MKLKKLKDNKLDQTYDWEDAFFLNREVFCEEDNLQKIFGHLCRAFNVQDALLVIDIGSKRGYSYQSLNEIHLIESHCRLSVLLHEFAHLLVWDKIIMESWEQGVKELKLRTHGPEWLTYYMLLLNWVMGVSIFDLMVSAKKYKLDFIKDILLKHGKNVR